MGWSTHSSVRGVEGAITHGEWIEGQSSIAAEAVPALQHEEEDPAADAAREACTVERADEETAGGGRSRTSSRRRRSARRDGPGRGRADGAGADDGLLVRVVVGDLRGALRRGG